MIYLLILILIGFVFGYGVTTYTIKIVKMIGYLEGQHKLLTHPEFKDEADNFKQSIENIKNFIIEIPTSVVLQSILQFSTIYYTIFTPAYDPLIIVALALGYVVWYIQLIKLRERKFIAQGLCEAVETLKQAINLYEIQLNTSNKENNNE